MRCFFMIIFLVVLFLLIILYFVFVPVRLIINNPVKTIYYTFNDVVHYFKYKKWRNFSSGSFTSFDSKEGVVFGSGKTLSAVHQVCFDYDRFNDKQIYDTFRKKWVTQKIHILTNLTLFGYPYEKLINLGQIVSSCEKFLNEDKVNDTLTCVIVLIDECQNQLHCRSFKDNLSPMMLKALTECRHYNMSIYYTCPRFSQVDALLRQCTSLSIKNRKLWRFQLQTVFDASQIENGTKDISQLKPLKKTGFFITNKLFDTYDTKEIIDTLKKAKDKNDLMSDSEILELQQDIKQKFIN